jgi:hypothetical protein
MDKITRTEHKLTERTYKCGHCGIDALMFIVCEGEHTITENHRSYGALWFTDFYQLLLCPSCNSINALKTSYDSENTIPVDEDEEEYYGVVVEYLFPSIKSGNFKNLPSLVEKSYAIAIKLKKLEPIASVIFSRKSLEAICVDQKATGRDLKDRIDNLAQKGAIPTLLKDAAHSVRLLGNEGAHELDAEVSVDDAETLLALCDAIIGYVYEAPQLVQRIQERLAKSKEKE